MEEKIYVWSESQKALVDGLIAERNAAQAELAQLRDELAAAKKREIELSADSGNYSRLYEQLGASSKRAEHAEMLLKMWIAKMYPSNETEWQFGSTYISDDLAILTRAALETAK